MTIDKLDRNAGAPAYPIRAVDRVCDLLDALHDADDGMSLTELAAQTDLPRCSALRYLSVLVARGYVSRDHRDNRYRLANRQE